MDTGYDFIQPEFLNILFFEQKNLVIFPYMDLKHLHSLELFTVGYNVFDLDATSLHNLKEIIDYEKTNSYSQNKNFYFIYNIDKERLKDLITTDDFRCIININEDVSKLIYGDNFVLYNKKNKKFLNYNQNDSTLEFEKHLILKSKNKINLTDELQFIKTKATRLYNEIINENNNEIIKILSEFNQQFWPKILNFVENFYKIKIPDIPNYLQIENQQFKLSDQKNFDKEYELIITTNSKIAREFVQCLHEYRSKHVNPSNLDLEQLYNPQKLYNYLRNHHWDHGIPEDFINEWTQMKNTAIKLTKNDLNDLNMIFNHLKMDSNVSIVSEVPNKNQVQKEEKIGKSMSVSIKNFSEFKKKLSEKLHKLEELIDNL